jgi:hypothetical protein
MHPRGRAAQLARAAVLPVIAACGAQANPADDSAPVPPGVIDVVVSNPHTPANTMMYAVTVTVSSLGVDAKVGFAQRGTDCETGAWKMGPTQRFETEDTLTWVLYNFVPGQPYDYRVEVGSEVECGELGTPTLPASLAALDLRYAKGEYETEYLLFDTDDCSATEDTGGHRYLIAVDPATESIVWYLEVAAHTTIGGLDLSGWRYQSGRILATVDKRYLYEWAWDGSVISAKDVAGEDCDGTDSAGPCIHHDAVRSDGMTYVITTEQSDVDAEGTNWDVCGTGSRFLDDGFQVLDETLATAQTHFLMRDLGYDPHEDAGPNVLDEEPVDSCDANLWANYFDPFGAIDWIHLNSIAPSSEAGTAVFDLSAKEWDQVLRVDHTGALLWRLSPHAGYSDWEIRIAPGVNGRASFASQHDVHAIASDTLIMFDNMGDVAGSRVLRLTLEDDVATIDRSWAVADAKGIPLTCRIEGSAQLVSGTEMERAVAMCNDEFTIVELADSSGNPTVPPLVVWVPERDFCAEGGPELRRGLRGWYRAFPVDRLGDF